MSELNTQIKEAIDSFDINYARELLRTALKEANADTYYLASKVALDEEQKESFLRKSLDLDPFHEDAKRALGSQSQNTSSVQNKEVAPDHVKSSITGNELADTKAVLGTLLESVTMYSIPLATGTVRTTIPANAQVVIASRTPESKWYQALYKATTNKIVYGWIQANKVKNLINSNGNPVNSLDIEITKFELNVRSDATEMENYYNNLFWGGCGESCSYFLIFPAIIEFLSLTFNKKYRLEREEHKKEVELSDDLRKFYKELQLNMRTDYEVLQDAQRDAIFTQAALQIGGNMLTRMVTNKQEIKIRRQ